MSLNIPEGMNAGIPATSTREIFARDPSSFGKRLCYIERYVKRGGIFLQLLTTSQALILRSDKYINRCNTVLLRAVMHVWVARERGQLLFRIRDVRILQTALAMWQHQFKAIHVMQGDAFTLWHCFC